MDLWSMLPLLEGWKYRDYVETSSRNILAGKSVTLFDETNIKGFMTSGMISVNNPQAKYGFQSDAYVQSATMYQLNLAGLIAPAQLPGQIFFLVKYDTINNIYTGLWAPALPTPFNNKMKFTITSPADSATTIHGFMFNWLKIEDEQLFRKTLKEALGTDKLR